MFERAFLFWYQVTESYPIADPEEAGKHGVISLHDVVNADGRIPPLTVRRLYLHPSVNIHAH
jgi:hypothetical protein